MKNLTSNKKLDLGARYWGWGMILIALTAVLGVTGMIVFAAIGFGFWAIILSGFTAVCFVLSLVYAGLSLREGYY